MRQDNSHEGNRDEGEEMDGKVQHSSGKVDIRLSSVITRYIDGSNEGDDRMEDHNGH